MPAFVCVFLVGFIWWSLGFLTTMGLVGFVCRREINESSRDRGNHKFTLRTSDAMLCCSKAFVFVFFCVGALINKSTNHQSCSGDIRTSLHIRERGLHDLSHCFEGLCGCFQSVLLFADMDSLTVWQCRKTKNMFFNFKSTSMRFVYHFVLKTLFKETLWNNRRPILRYLKCYVWHY